jgi:hypothetical protein
VDPVLSSGSPQQLDGYSYAGDDPASASDPSGQMLCSDNICGSVQFLEHHFSSGGGSSHSSGICYYCRYAPSQYYGSGGSSAPSDPGYFLPVTPAYYGGPGGFIHRMMASPAPFQYPVTHAVAAQSRPVAAGSVWGPDCNPTVFRLGACPSERGAAGTTPAQVKQSAIGALMILTSAIPIGDILGTLFGGARVAEGAAQSGEVYYRTMSGEHYAQLAATGRVPATGETFISPTRGFSEAYSGTLVRLVARPGTTDALVNVGVRDSSALTSQAFPDMPLVSKGWSADSAFFKGEGTQINIGLGRGPALNIFNEGLIDFERLAG